MKFSLTVKFAIIAGILNCLFWYIAAHSLNYYDLAVDRYRYYATMLLLIGGIFSSVYFERKAQAGHLEFKQGLKTGIIFAIILGLILGIFNYMYYNVIAPDVVDFFKSEEKKIMLGQNLSETDIRKNMELIDSYFGSFRMMMSTIIMGLIFSLLAASVLRKKNPQLPFSAN